jgi:hypothetical protein
MTPELLALSRRLEELEKQVAHLAALVTEQSDTGRTVVAQSLVVRDERKQRRAELGMVIPVGQTEAQPWLGLFDANESVRACVGLGREGGWLELYSANGQAIAEVREFQDGPRIALFDATGNTRLSLNVSERGSFAYLFSPNGKQHLRLELFSSGQATVVMQDPRGEPRFLIAVDQNGRASLAFLKDNNVLWTAP